MPSFTLTQSLPEVQSIICHHLWHQTLYNLNLLNTKLCFYLIPSNISTIFSTLLKLFTFPYFLHISSFLLTQITFNNQSVQPLPFIYTIHFYCLLDFLYSFGKITNQLKSSFYLSHVCTNEAEGVNKNTTTVTVLFYSCDYKH